MNKYVQTIIIIVGITLGLGVIFTIVLEQSSTTVSIPLNPDKISIYLEKGCTKEAVEFINGSPSLKPPNSLEKEVEKCLMIIIDEKKNDIFS